MNHHSDDIRIFHQVPGNSTEQELPGPGSAVATNNEKIRTELIAALQNSLTGSHLATIECFYFCADTVSLQV